MTALKVAFYCSDIAHEIIPRVPPGELPHLYAKRDIKRYYLALAYEREAFDFTPGEAGLICDAIQGIDWHAEENIWMLPGVVSEAAHRHGLGEKWGADIDVLTKKLRGQTLIRLMAILDAAERFLNIDLGTTEAKLKDVGLIK